MGQNNENTNYFILFFDSLKQTGGKFKCMASTHCGNEINLHYS